jgi:hypothetical protein
MNLPLIDAVAERIQRPNAVDETATSSGDNTARRSVVKHVRTGRSMAC